MDNDLSDDLCEVNYELHNKETKQTVSRIIRIIVLAQRREKLDYGTIRYIYRQVLKRTNLTRPQEGSRLYELPTTDELDSFFACIIDPQIKLFFLLLNHCGLRVSEACNLKVSKIDFQNLTIFITGKGDKDRLVPLTPNLAEKIKLFLSGRNHVYLFESKLGTPFTTRRIEQLCKSFKEKSCITKKLTPHTFRHYYFTRLAEQGVSETIRAMLGGHADNKTQEIYSHVGLAGVKDQILETLIKMEVANILK